SFFGALFRPVESRALRVRVDYHDAFTLRGPGSGHMQRQGGLADAALVVEERNDHGASPPRTASGWLRTLLITMRKGCDSTSSAVHSSLLIGRLCWIAMVEPKWPSTTIGR